MIDYKGFLTEYDTYLFEHTMELLYEKLIMFQGGAKYGQVVFTSGGAGSGKGFARDNFIESTKFKVRDVDELKKAFLKISKLKNKYPEIRDLNLRNKIDVSTLHAFVKKTGASDNTLDLLLSDVKQDRLPNILFDITGKSIKDFEEVVPRLLEVGYEARNLHLVWILANWKTSFKANLTRERVVAPDIFLGTHRGAAATMSRLLDQNKMPAGMNGAFHVILNNRENTVFFEPSVRGQLFYKGKKVPATDPRGRPIQNVKSFYYITAKREGRPFRPESEWKEELFKQIVDNIPGGEKALNQSLRDLADEQKKT